ncbi:MULTISPECIES: AdeC/AdeK/OprM family multidrug efflux complex outer membrane factor [unclassified Acinetobacter]|uniref:AdeC/AdeK/OprM family multidrug efflux complex outer membrane factor n=1 Tax=unclassified Acinetobacter TaxID=196816 RepID=UPI002934F5B5|nr:MULTISPECIES: AdeC/AdeK/OprM family multidrug efflux complex outer membrane factor [unclassified Acinetobacter]WOE30353.1 AdeC/AdeK/OprM family multidrug efflux complex outer membrane factor [Acinetobacter sp. SAAs470]WOE38544.1 AdeC/AdeK/OprM family multidrug efflux complex outer membrane factor [Acinetobacter sp. SAAs474]
MVLNFCPYLGRGTMVSILALTLAACQSMRGPEPVVHADLPLAYPHAHGQTIAEVGYQDFFSDPRLVKVINLALENNRNLRTATLNIERAQQLFQISANSQLPTIGANGGILRQNSQGTTKAATKYNIGLGITAYELDFWGRIRSLKDSALDRYLATATARDAIQITLISQVAQTWLAYAYANANLALAQKTLNSQQQAYQLNQKRFNTGLDNELSVRQAQISVETARADVANYKTQVVQALNALNLVVGQPVATHLLAQTPVKQVTSITSIGTGLPSDLLLNRPDLRSAEFKLSAAGADIGAAKALLFPTISLTANAGYASTDLNQLFKSGTFVWSVGPSINLPIFDWGTRKANIKVAEIDQQIALSDYEKAIQSAFTEVNDALAVRATLADRLSAQHRLLNASQAAYDLSSQRFKAGIDDYLNVLDAQRSSYRAAQGLLALEQANLNNQIELYKSLGGGMKVQTTAVHDLSINQ